MIRGFTFLELILVVFIMFVLFGAMQYLPREKKTDAILVQIQADMQKIKSAALMLHADTGYWPCVGSLGTSLIDDLDCSANPIPNWNGPYLDEWEKDPWGRNYTIYEVNSAGIILMGVKNLGKDNLVGGSGVNQDTLVTITNNKAL